MMDFIRVFWDMYHVWIIGAIVCGVWFLVAHHLMDPHS